MYLPITHGDPIARDHLLRVRHAPDISPEDRYIVGWLSADGQADMWMGYGPTEGEAIADAQRECREAGMTDGSLVVHEIKTED